MSTFITDTIKPKNNSDFTLAELEDIWQNDNTKVSDAISPATDTKLGRVKIGDNIINNNGVIDIPNYLSIGDSEPTDGSKLWIATKEQYIPSSVTSVGASAKEDNVIEMKEDGLFLPSIEAPIEIPGILHWQNRNITLNKTMDIYFDAANGDDSNDGTSFANALKNVKVFLAKAPRSTNGYSYRLWLQGNFTSQGVIDFNGFSNMNLQLYMVGTPTFQGLRFYECRRVYTYRSFNLNLGTPPGNNYCALGSFYGSWVCLTNDTNTAFTITINGGSNSNTTWNTRGIQAGMNACLIATNGNLTLKVTNSRMGALSDNGGLIAIYHSAFSSNYRGFYANYGLITYCADSGKYSNSVISGGAALLATNGGKVLNGANRNGYYY